MSFQTKYFSSCCLTYYIQCSVSFSANAAPTAAASAAAADDDMDDMFGDDDEETAEEAAANKARAERMATARRLKEEKDAREGKVKKDKPKPVEKSLVVLEVKPWEGKFIVFCGVLHKLIIFAKQLILTLLWSGMRFGSMSKMASAGARHTNLSQLLSESRN